MKHADIWRNDLEREIERTNEFVRVARAWLVAHGWPPIEGELLLEVKAQGRKRILRLRPADPKRHPPAPPGSIAIHSKRGTFRSMVSPVASDADSPMLPPAVLTQLVRKVPSMAGEPRPRRRPESR